MPTALIREIPDTFDKAIVAPGGRAPNVALARRQHRAYREQLDRAGYTIETIPADDECPDCVFVEDTAVIIGEIALIARPGAAEREKEVPPVANFLGQHFETNAIESPGTLDGGDVMIFGTTVYVGASKRSNRDGIGQLEAVVKRQRMNLVVIPVEGVLHLKSAVLPVNDATVMVTPGTVDESLLGGLRILHEPPGERHRFSALPLADGRVLTTAGAPEAAALLEEIGLVISPIDVSEILAADGGLACMSILFDPVS